MFCNGDDTCSGGSCTSHDGDPCDGPNDGDDDCTETCDENANNCSGDDGNGTGCDDGFYCTGTDICTNGTCAGDDTDNTCDGPDTDNDCVESCVEGSSSYTCDGNDPNGSQCNNGNKICTDGTCA